MFGKFRSGVLLAATCAGGILPRDAEAGSCLGEQRSTSQDRSGHGAVSRCEDPETGAEATVSIPQYAGGIPEGLMVTGGGGSLQSWTVYGYTFDVNGRVIDNCTHVLTSPDAFFREFVLAGCEDAATLLVYAEFNP
jgi:hypothetical protein